MRAESVSAVIAFLLAPPAGALTVPDGFVHEPVVTGPFTAQTSGFAFLPDGRPLLLELQTGVVRLAATGSPVADSILTIPGVNADHPERGLLGAAVDPGWPARPYVYFQYTHTDSVIHVTMYTATGALTDPGSTALVLTSPYFVLDDLPDSVGIHNGGTIRFGPDGMLYVGVGDDSRSCKPQDLAEYHGKMLRLDVSPLPGPGSGPPPKADITPVDNPFSGPGDIERLVFAWGLRNPYRFTVDETGDVFIGSVGSHLFEEINVIVAGDSTGPNYGWPQFEGPQALGCCGTCGQGNAFTFAVHDIPHPAGNIAVVGGPVLRSTVGSDVSFPATHDGDYLYFDLYAGTGHRLTRTGSTWDFAAPEPGQPDSVTWCDGFIGVADVQLGADGGVYLAALGYTAELPTGLHRIIRDPAVGVAAAAGPQAGLRFAPNPLLPGASTHLGLARDGAGPVRVRLFDAAGRLVHLWTPSPGATSITWNGRDSSGRALPAGVYFVRLERPGRPDARSRLVLLR